jgi:hypothetical protein
VYAGEDASTPYKIAGKQQRDPATGELLFLTLPTVVLEFDSNCNYDWCLGNGLSNASTNLRSNCWGALTTSNAWLSKKYHATNCSALVRDCQR